MKKIVFVIGMHRCGTSLLSNCLVENGFSIGKRKNKDKNWQNPNGYFENNSFTKFHNDILEYNNSTWCRIRKNNMEYTKKHIDQYKKIIEDEFEDCDLILIKDPRLSFFTDFLNDVCKELNIQHYFIFCTRNKEECCMSLEKAQNLKHSISDKLYDDTMSKYKKDFLKVDYNDMVYKNNETMKNIFQYLKLENNIDTNNIVDENLYRNRLKVNSEQ